MKHVLLTLLVVAASTHAAPILAEAPAEAPEEEGIGVTAEESTGATAEESEIDEAPYYPRLWVCYARPWYWLDYRHGPNWPRPSFAGMGSTRRMAASTAEMNCRNHSLPRTMCTVIDCHPYP